MRFWGTDARGKGLDGAGAMKPTNTCWLCLLLLNGLVLLLQVVCVCGQTETPEWQVRAAALQRYLGYDVPLDKLTLTATHNSFSSDRSRLTHSNFEVK
ncbi:unnamed protein product [Sphacelaria rigidula]